MRNEYDTVAIDGDILVYRAAAAGQHTYYDLYEDGELVDTFEYSKDAKGYVKDMSEFFMIDDVLYEIKPRLEYFELEKATNSFDTQMKYIKSKLKAKKYKLYLTGTGNYREKVATIRKYKGTRENVEKPYWLYNVKDYAVNKWGAVVVDNIECDDAISVIAYRGYKHNPDDPNTVCVSADKDLLNTPGYHFNPGKDDEPQLVTMEEANKNFYLQLLKGDKTVDNIPAVEGLSKRIAEKYGIRKGKYLGPKAAEALLEGLTTEQELYERCYEVYEAYYTEQEGWDEEKQKYCYTHWNGTPMERTIAEMIEEQAHLLWMIREKGIHWVKPVVTWQRFGGYECSTKGDKRFSAFCAKMPDGRTVEQHYQCDVKGYDTGGVNWRLGKGKPPLDKQKDLWNEYLKLWKIWAENNPKLLEELRFKARSKKNILSDMFSSGNVNQARALAMILNGVDLEADNRVDLE